jgi:arginyl-tRNA synthetase
LGAKFNVYHLVEKRIREALGTHIREKYGIEAQVVTERPPRLEMGEVASPVCFELAKKLKRAPRQIAAEITADIGAKLSSMGGVARIEVAGGGYLNAFLDRAEFLSQASARAGHEAVAAGTDAPKVIVEHTNINPNKAAHIGHLRNAALGDSFVRLLRYTGRRVEVQNYIDNTGVQVADVVVGFRQIEKKTPAEVRALSEKPRFDYLCWDLYARVTQYYEEDQTRTSHRADALKAIEADTGDEAEIATCVADAIVRRHLRTMERLEVEYDLLPRESEILHLKFWDTAFALLKERGAIQFVTSGKNAGCWVMRSADTGESEEDQNAAAKIIVRSNGTVTYVGKDIAYQLWKFGLLGRDFNYRRFDQTPDGRPIWVTSTEPSDPNAPKFGRGAEVFNVIDSRQSYLQHVVVAGLRALGYEDEANRSVHFSYEMVALSPRSATEMGYVLSPEEEKRPYVEMSGRRGLGVKADDLLDRLEASTRAEVDARHPALGLVEREQIAHVIAIGALRYFLLKFTRNAVITFDFKDALSFEGETGPYCQYAVVRARSIWRKGAELAPELLDERTIREGAEILRLQQPDAPEKLNKLLSGSEGDEFWELILHAGSLYTAIQAAVATQEPAFIAKYAFLLAQIFNNFYHRHHVLSEKDPQRKALLLLITHLVERQLVTALHLMGIESPEKM